MMKLINTFKDSLLKLGVMWEMFKMDVFNSSPVKAFAYVWGLDWLNKLLISFNTTLILICIVSGYWDSAVAIVGITYITISADYYRSKQRELLKLLQERDKTDKKDE